MDRHRIDQWLKYVCLFKSREEAGDACRGGHVKINGQSVKPAANVREGDRVEFLKGDVYRRVVVSRLPEVQTSREAARTMYVDETPVQPRPPANVGGYRDRGTGRPTKKDRREMNRWKNRS